MVSAFVKFIYLAYEKLKESEYQNWLEPALRVGRIALIIVAMFFVTAPVIKVDVKDPTTDTTYETVFKYSPYDLISYELSLSQDMKRANAKARKRNFFITKSPFIAAI
jgi:hypothetical protein